MLRLVIRRLLWAIPSMILVTFLVYGAVRLGTNPLNTFLKLNPRATKQEQDLYVRENGLYSGFGGYIRGYFEWLWRFVQGPSHWSTSIRGSRKVWKPLKLAMVNSIRLGGAATIIGVVLGLGAGIFVALRPGSLRDAATNTAAFVGTSIPPFVSAVLLQLFFAVYWSRWFGKSLFPTSGIYPPGHHGFNIVLMVKYMVLPCTVVAIQIVAVYTRYMRASLLEVLNSDYMRTARAKGISERRVLVHHALRNALIPVVTVAAIDVGAIVGGLIITERIFDYPGMGVYFLKALDDGDFPLLMPWMVVVVGAVILFNLLADLSYAWLDPGFVLTDVIDPNAMDANANVDKAQGLTTESVSPGRLALRRFLKHRAAMTCAVILIIMLLWVALSPLTARYGVNEAVFKVSANRRNSNLSPSGIAWFGTDSIGRDIYSRLIYGLRVSIIIGIASAIFSALLGVAIGAYAGFRGGFFDDVMMRVTDLFLAFPFLVALLVVRQFLGAVSFLRPVIGRTSSIRFVIVLFVIFGWMGVARLVRGQVLSLKEREFIEASRAVGASNFRIIARHLLPNSIGPILVALTTGVVAAIVGESTLSFFGYGPQPGGGTSLGLLVADAKGAVQSGYWWLAVFPCVVLVLLALCINFVGDGLRDATDPKLQHGGKR